MLGYLTASHPRVRLCRPFQKKLPLPMHLHPIPRACIMSRKLASLSIYIEPHVSTVAG
jgi:hypothetical protein